MYRASLGFAALLGLLQLASSVQLRGRDGKDELVMVHIPFNFGNTIAKNALFGHGKKFSQYGMAMAAAEMGHPGWPMLRMVAQADAHYWGPLNPDLHAKSGTTGCSMYYTPQTLWPEALLADYIGNRTAFGVLRNPYDRLVSFFNGMGGMFYPKQFETCDADGAVRQMMEEVLAGKIYEHNCQLVPQAEYFKGPYAVKLPIDMQEFPYSANKVLKEHGYDSALVDVEDEITVAGGKCGHMWGEDLSAGTKALVKQVYKEDFDLLCKNFGQCDADAATCLVRAKGMCPDKAWVWDDGASMYQRRA